MAQFLNKLQTTGEQGSSREDHASESQTLSKTQPGALASEYTLQRQKEWEQERNQLVQSIMRRDVELAEIRHALQESTRACHDLRTQMNVRFDEITYLTRRTIEAEARVEEVIASTSWKVTAPARRIVSLLMRRKR